MKERNVYDLLSTFREKKKQYFLLGFRRSALFFLGGGFDRLAQYLYESRTAKSRTRNLVWKRATRVFLLDFPPLCKR